MAKFQINVQKNFNSDMQSSISIEGNFVEPFDKNEQTNMLTVKHISQLIGYLIRPASKN